MTLAMILEKPSLCTRVTFELGICQLGGRALSLSPEEAGLGKREAVKDVARNLSCWVDVIMARVHRTRRLLSWRSMPPCRSSTALPILSIPVRRWPTT